MPVPNLYEIIHTHDEGSEVYYMQRPENFDMPAGYFDGEHWEMHKQEQPSLTGVIAYLEIPFEPEKGEFIEVRSFDHTIHEPTVRELARLTGPRRQAPVIS